MMGFSLSHLIIILIIVLIFGARRLPELGGALGKGLRSFKKGLEGKDDDVANRQVEDQTQDSSKKS